MYMQNILDFAEEKIHVLGYLAEDIEQEAHTYKGMNKKEERSAFLKNNMRSNIIPIRVLQGEKKYGGERCKI